MHLIAGVITCIKMFLSTRKTHRLQALAYLALWFSFTANHVETN